MANKLGIVLGVIMLLLLGFLAYYYLSTTHAPQTYTINSSMLPNSGNATNFFQVENYKTTTSSNLPIAPVNNSGFVRGYVTSITNASPVRGLNMPVAAFSIFYLFNNTAYAAAQYSHLNNLTVLQHTIGGLNESTFSVQIGDASSGFKIWPETPNLILFIVDFKYKTTAVRIGVYENLGSNSTSAAIYLAQKVLANLKNATS